MQTGRYRVRRGFGGKAILQYEIDTPSLIGGHVASDVRERSWYDVEFDKLDNIAVILPGPLGPFNPGLSEQQYDALVRDAMRYRARAKDSSIREINTTGPKIIDECGR